MHSYSLVQDNIMNQAVVLNRPVTNPLIASSKIRLLKDRLAQYGITAGGLMVLMTLLMIFGYLLYVVEPVFRAVQITAQDSQPVNAGVRALGSDELNEVGYYYDQQGQLNFYPLIPTRPIPNKEKVSIETQYRVIELPLKSSQAISSTARLTDAESVAFGLTDGNVLISKPHFLLNYNDDTRTIVPNVAYPYGQESLVIDDQGQPLVKIAFAANDEMLTIVALTADNRVLLSRQIASENFMTEEIQWQGDVQQLTDLPAQIDQLILTPSQQLLFVRSGNQLYLYDLSQDEVGAPREVVTVNSPQANVTAVGILSGGSSVLIGNTNGVISQWFETSGDNGRKLSHVRDFSIEGAVASIVAEPYRKTFAVVSDTGELSLFHSTSEATLITKQLTGQVSTMRFSPRYNALIFNSNDQIEFYQVDNQHPEVTWSALWQEVWYEGYSEPDYVWQSTSASDDFEPKLSLVPISFGTIKAAFYAMLFAMPLAVAGAIYTAYFMPAGLRKVVKPTVETMEALPTVILGFLAGLWLAPIIETRLPFVLMLVVFLPVAIVLFSWLHYRLPPSVKFVVNEQFSTLLLIPIVLLVGWGCYELSPLLELYFMQGDARQFISNELGINFDQRNALVVGIAMGFAVIPTIFSITEDAIFSVPSHLSNGSLALGATRWQTLVGVVLLTASPGIFSAVMMGLGRAVGETMIVLMATGNTPIMDWNIFEGMRTLSANIAVEMPESEVGSTHYRVLFLAAFVLFIFTFMFNTVAELVRQNLREKYGSL